MLDFSLIVKQLDFLKRSEERSCEKISSDLFLQKVSLPEVRNYCVTAIDGSQIYPSKHEGVFDFGLIQIAYARFDYSVKPSIFQRSFSTTVVSTETINQKLNIDATKIYKEHLDLCRQLLEIEYGLGVSPCLNNFVLLDGALETKHLNNKHPKIKDAFFLLLTDLLKIYLEKRIFVASYSSAENTEFIQQLPNKGFYFIKNNNFEEISSCMFSTGQEIVKIQFLTGQQELLIKNLPFILDQIEIGKNYPLALAEAHHAAEISKEEQQFFYKTVRSKLNRQISAKLSSKQTMFL